ncbi:hypothetical protein ACLH2J_24670 [Klebsiella michiganensis]|uniref:hypothetical protein n=1 Tax=Klebsiella TaxID=570 RepID=UPI000FEB74AE|nr:MULTISPECIES: hypothetical protein [Klebsiella]MBD0905662.1 hypothetical protein [Klebsiella grimontii]MDH0489690.1 hypothetical protein [Klebsiella michiganensis]RWS80867.1 hypothetical protein DN614_25015 [Klebsiella michiganensis]
MKSAKVKLLESTFKGYTGLLCGVQFEDGISVQELPFVDQQRICASMRAETIDGRNVSAAGAYSERYNVTTENLKEHVAEPVTNLDRGTVQPGIQMYTREELEAVADSEGIAGLRLIGGNIGVKAKGIVEMIDGILKAQGGA